MTGNADFTEDEWKLLLEGPPSAGLIVVSAQRGGTFREAFAIGKAYTEARKQHGDSELLDELTAAPPTLDPEHVKQAGGDVTQVAMDHLRDAVALLEQKGTPAEVDDYRRFVLDLSQRVANAHREGGEQVSEAEQAAIDEISASLGAPDT